MHASFVAQLGQHQRSYHVATHCLHSVIFAPVDVGASCLASTVDDVSWLELVEDLLHLDRVFHAVIGSMDSLALRIKQFSEVAADPALAAGKEKAVFRIHV
jgi:hypothetical protein